MPSFKEIDIKNLEYWEDILENFPKELIDIYYKPGYINFFLQDLNETAVLFYYNDNEKIAIAPFIKRCVNDLGYDLESKYYDLESVYGYSGFVTNTSDSDFIGDFFQTFDAFCRKNNIISELCRYNPLSKNVVVTKKFRTSIFDRKTVTIDLCKPYEEIWTKQYSSKNRNIVRKAEKLGYKYLITSNPTLDEITEFTRIYNYSMRMVEAEEFYLFKIDAYIKMFNLLQNDVFLAMVKTETEEIISAAIFLRYNEKFHYHLSGRSENADNSATNYLLDNSVRFAQNSGLKQFHLGGGRTNADNDSLLKFKKSFGESSTNFYISKKIHNEVIYNEVVEQWKIANPNLSEKYSRYILKYRYKK